MDFFKGIDTYHENITCYLIISEIDEITFDESNGINTIQDAINDKYFSINFYTIDESSNRIDYSFNNLKDTYNGSKGTIIKYINDNDYYFTPITFSNNNKLPIEECECTIHITNDDSNKEIYSNLTRVNEEYKLVIKDSNDIILNKD